MKKKIVYVIGAILAIGIIGSALGGNDDVDKDTSPKKEVVAAKTPATDSKTKEEKKDSAATDSSILKSAISEAIKDQIGDGERIKNVVVEGTAVTIDVDLSKTKPSILSNEDLAISRAQSITDAILDLPENQEKMWDKITISFKGIGKVTRTKKDVKLNEYDMKYFEINELD